MLSRSRYATRAQDWPHFARFSLHDSNSLHPVYCTVTSQSGFSPLDATPLRSMEMPTRIHNAGTSYVDRISDCVGKNHEIQRVLAGEVTGPVKAFYSTFRGKIDLGPSEILKHAHRDHADRRESICVIENINREWIAALGPEWNIAPAFFTSHAENPQGPVLWEAMFNQEATRHFREADKSPMQYIEGVVPHLREGSSTLLGHRRSHHHHKFGMYANIKTSYYRVSETFCKCSGYQKNYICFCWLRSDLFLVDRPLERQDHGVLPALSSWIPCASNRGGLPIPQMYRTQHFSMLEVLQSFFSHRWQVRLLFQASDAIHPAALSYFVCSSLWRTNLQWIDESIKEVAFRDLRNPSVRINDLLHDLRQDLSTVRDQVLMAKTWMPAQTSEACKVILSKFFHNTKLSPIETFENILVESQNLDRFLMDTFQLLMSSISVLDSQASILEARRSARLTQLATIYVPLSFVTGVFGMNVKEINNSPLSVWTAIIALLVTVIVTAALLWTMSSTSHPLDKKRSIWHMVSWCGIPRKVGRTTSRSSLNSRQVSGEMTVQPPRMTSLESILEA